MKLSLTSRLTLLLSFIVALASASAFSNSVKTITRTGRFEKVASLAGAIHAEAVPHIGAVEVRDGSIFLKANLVGQTVIKVLAADYSIVKFPVHVQKSWNERQEDGVRGDIILNVAERRSGEWSSSTQGIRVETPLLKGVDSLFDVQKTSSGSKYGVSSDVIGARVNVAAGDWMVDHTHRSQEIANSKKINSESTKIRNSTSEHTLEVSRKADSGSQDDYGVFFSRLLLEDHRLSLGANMTDGTLSKRAGYGYFGNSESFNFSVEENPFSIDKSASYTKFNSSPVDQGDHFRWNQISLRGRTTGQRDGDSKTGNMGASAGATLFRYGLSGGIDYSPNKDTLSLNASVMKNTETYRAIFNSASSYMAGKVLSSSWSFDFNHEINPSLVQNFEIRNSSSRDAERSMIKYDIGGTGRGHAWKLGATTFDMPFAGEKNDITYYANISKVFGRDLMVGLSGSYRDTSQRYSIVGNYRGLSAEYGKTFYINGFEIESMGVSYTVGVGSPKYIFDKMFDHDNEYNALFYEDLNMNGEFDEGEEYVGSILVQMLNGKNSSVYEERRPNQIGMVKFESFGSYDRYFLNLKEMPKNVRHEGDLNVYDSKKITRHRLYRVRDVSVGVSVKGDPHSLDDIVSVKVVCPGMVTEILYIPVNTDKKIEVPLKMACRATFSPGSNKNYFSENPTVVVSRDTEKA